MNDSQISEKMIMDELERLITNQRSKVMKIARERIPYLTSDDVLNPHDFPELLKDSIFNFEDGILSGFVSAQIAIRQKIRQLEL